MPNELQKEIARTSTLMRLLPEQHVEMLLSKAIWRHYDRDETLFLQGEEATAIHIVLDGWIKLYRVTANGSEAVVSVFTRGDSFGEAVALRNLTYPVSAQSVTASEVMHIPANVLVGLILRDAQVGLSILASTFNHLHSLVAQLEQLKAQTAGQRVAEFLLNLGNSDSGSCRVTLPYDKVLIAGRLGIKPESLSRAFSRLKAFGVEIDKNHANIHNVKLLRNFVDAEK